MDLSLRIRRVIYLLGLAALVATGFVAVYAPEAAPPTAAAAGTLMAVGLGTALANPTRRPGDHAA